LIEINGMDDPTDEDIQRSDELPEEIEKAKAEIKRLENQEKALAPLSSDKAKADEPEPMIIEGKATVVKTSEPVAPRLPFSLPKKKTEPQDMMYRALACWAASEGSREPLPNIVRDRLHGADREAIPHIIRAAANPALTSVAGWAQELTSTVNMGFLDRL